MRKAAQDQLMAVKSDCASSSSGVNNSEEIQADGCCDLLVTAFPRVKIKAQILKEGSIGRVSAKAVDLLGKI